MKRIRRKTVIALALAAGLVAGPDCSDGGRWIDLLPPGAALAPWRVLQGSPAVENGVLVLDGRSSDVTIVARDVDIENGTVEMKILRPDPALNAGPCTAAVRLTASINWGAVYFVCRPDSLEVCRASWLHRFPPPERKVTFRSARRPEVWRFVMKDRTIECYRSGRKMLSYADAEPRAGTIGLTASRCRVELLGVRYRPAAEP